MKMYTSILLIDDDKINNYINVRLFKKLKNSLNITITRNGAEALKHLEKKSEALPDLIFLDIEMPIMNGMKFLEEYSKLNSENKDEVKIIILAATIHPNYLKVLNQYPIHSFLTKPLTTEKIQTVMEDHCSYSENINPESVVLLEPKTDIYPSKI